MTIADTPRSADVIVLADHRAKRRPAALPPQAEREAMLERHAEALRVG